MNIKGIRVEWNYKFPAGVDISKEVGVLPFLTCTLLALLWPGHLAFAKAWTSHGLNFDAAYPNPRERERERERERSGSMRFGKIKTGYETKFVSFSYKNRMNKYFSSY
mgnify:CR=1 FL=1